MATLKTMIIDALIDGQEINAGNFATEHGYPHDMGRSECRKLFVSGCAEKIPSGKGPKFKAKDVEKLIAMREMAARNGCKLGGSKLTTHKSFTNLLQAWGIPIKPPKCGKVSIKHFMLDDNND